TGGGLTTSLAQTVTVNSANYRLNFSPITAPPQAPTGLTAVPTSMTAIRLSWTDVNGESGFKVERSSNGTTGWTQIGTTPMSGTSYLDSGLAVNATYYYRVRATNSFGDSPYSATTSATTSAFVIDNVGAGYSEVGSGWLSWATGYNGSVRYAHAGSGA